jgi:tRNA pseudouridine13 synthase
MSTANSDQLAHATAKSLKVLGKIRATPEDFRVEEIPAYEPSGEGQHLFVQLEKTGLNTQDAVAQMARALRADPAQASFAGLKDRHAVTTQWASFFGADPEAALALELPGIRVLRAARHPHKIRTGHLRGNRFVIRVECDAEPSFAVANAVLSELVATGCPNFYGEQRFGRDRQNLTRARRWLLEGGRAPRDRFERKLLVSTLQSEAFNHWLDLRMRRVGLGRALAGDVMRKEDSGGLFVAHDVVEVQARMDRWELSPTGPIFGTKLRSRVRRARARERGARGAGPEPRCAARAARARRGDPPPEPRASRRGERAQRSARSLARVHAAQGRVCDGRSA